jgi:1,4-alpha-glucan branching enzyme
MDRPLFSLLLHAHLPFVRHPEHADFLEERWLFEALIECYLPLVRMLDGWERDGVAGVINLTVSPTLAAMLSDDLLRRRFEVHLGRMEALGRMEEDRHALQPEWAAVARHYAERLREVRATWDRERGNVLGAWSRHARAGRLELLTCAATHALLPLLVEDRGALRGQIRTAVHEHRRHFGATPRGIWLPECAYGPGIEEELLAAGLRWFVVETHGLLLGHPPSPHGVFGPVVTPAGMAAFARDPASARQVWSRHGGYPGDPRYREFHSDLADVAEWGYLAPYAAGTGVRVATGFKYHRVTGGAGPKELYDPGTARAAVAEHARHFVVERARHLHAQTAAMGRPPFLLAPYDAELFGHWWYEGPEFLDAVVRRVAEGEEGIRMIGLGGYLAAHPVNPVSLPAASTWGEGGHLGVWLDASNAWMQRPLHSMAVRMTSHVRMESDPGEVRRRVLVQMARELMLAQASDWPFLVRMGTAKEYAQVRFETHQRRFRKLETMLSGREGWDEVALAEMEARDNLFPELDPQWWA